MVQWMVCVFFCYFGCGLEQDWLPDVDYRYPEKSINKERLPHEVHLFNVSLLHAVGVDL
jgi:hypothetical protein